MGFIVTYILIAILGLFAHPIIRKRRPGNKSFAGYYSALVIGGFFILDILIYAGAFNWFWDLISNLPWITIDNGQDFMWNSFLWLGVDFNVPYTSAGLHSIAVVLFLSYTPWYVFWKDGSRMLFGQKSYQEGYWWALAPIKKPKHDKKES